MAGNGTNIELSKDYNAPNMSSMVGVSSSPCTPMVDSFCPPIWDQPINGQSLGYCNMNVQNHDPSTSSMGWIPNAMIRDCAFRPSVSRMLPHSLPPFPPDSAFIERAARFSCFNGGNFSEMANPFAFPDPQVGPIQGPTEKDEAKNGVNMLSNQGDEAEFSGRGDQEELVKTAEEESSGGLKKRKRIEQNTENNEAPQADGDTSKEKGDHNASSKQESQGSDPHKEEYIHVRARRGQATNSHSLAERIRREKISERMKLLQDLVPGCSKVTGKAVMLDEIINYVQSLQRQVEFLSMKLATVNPHLDFNVEGFLAKDMLQPRPFPLDILAMPFPLHPLQPGLNQVGLQGARNSCETLQRPVGLDSTLYVPTSRHMQAWEDELHNVVHNGFNSSAPDSSDHMKAES
ncbi:hypothetical protein ACS0TY_008226 [Phlomoides rotata]